MDVSQTLFLTCKTVAVCQIWITIPLTAAHCQLCENKSVLNLNLSHRDLIFVIVTLYIYIYNMHLFVITLLLISHHYNCNLQVHLTTPVKFHITLLVNHILNPFTNVRSLEIIWCSQLALSCIQLKQNEWEWLHFFNFTFQVVTTLSRHLTSVIRSCALLETWKWSQRRKQSFIQYRAGVCPFRTVTGNHGNHRKSIQCATTTMLHRKAQCFLSCFGAKNLTQRDMK